MYLSYRISPVMVVASTVILLAVISFAQDAGTVAQKKDVLESGTVESVLAHPEGRVFDIVSKVIPVYDDYPFYDISILTPERAYVVRYESMGGYYPSAWQSGKQIKFRREKGQLLLLRYDGEFVPARIL
jgi:hypothetical protein